MKELKINKIYNKNELENIIFKEENVEIIYINKIDAFNIENEKAKIINIIEGYKCKKNKNIIENETSKKTKYYIIEII